MQPERIKQLIEAGMDTTEVQVTGDGRHFDAIIVADAFEGKTMLEQHRIVYAALGDHMREAIHALSMKTYTPEQWRKAGQ